MPVPFLKVMGADGCLNQALHHSFGFTGQETPEILPHLMGLKESPEIKMRDSLIEFLSKVPGSHGHLPHPVC